VQPLLAAGRGGDQLGVLELDEARDRLADVLTLRGREAVAFAA
jgi:hypothetical protein